MFSVPFTGSYDCPPRSKFLVCSRLTRTIPYELITKVILGHLKFIVTLS